MTSDTHRPAFAEGNVIGTSKPQRARSIALGAAILVAVLVGPPALSLGPANSPDPTAHAPNSLEIQMAVVRAALETPILDAELYEDHLSYGERRVGPLTFPEGAIEIPWTATAAATTGRSYPAGSLRNASAGSTTTAPNRERETPHLMPAALRPRLDGEPQVAPVSTHGAVLFGPESATLNGETRAYLDGLAAELDGNNIRLQLFAYGGEADVDQISPRRMALRRALAVRNYLMARGISQERMIVRAIGDPTSESLADRVMIATGG